MKFTSTVYGATSGSVGGLTYSRNRGGQYTRRRAIPSNPSSERQGIARENLAAAVSAWTNDLTSAERTAWASYAQSTPFVDSLGQQIILSGQQMYVRTYTSRIIAGLDPVNTAPTMSGLGNTPQWVTDPTIDASGSTVVGQVNVEGVTVTDNLAMYMSRPVPASRTPAHEPRRFTNVAAAVLIPPNWSVNFVTPYAYTAGQSVRTTVIILWADGRVSAEAFRDTIVAP